MNAYQKSTRNTNSLKDFANRMVLLCAMITGIAFQTGYAQAQMDENSSETVESANPPSTPQDSTAEPAPRTVILLPLLAYQGQLEWNPMKAENAPLRLSSDPSVSNPENAWRMWNQLYTKISLKRSSFRPFHPDTLIHWMKIWQKEETEASSLKAWIQKQSGAELEFIWEDMPMVSTVSRHSWYLFFMGRRISKRHLTLQWNLPDGGIAFRDTLYAADTLGTGFCGIIDCEFLPLSAKERREIDLRLEEKILSAFDVSVDRFLNPAKYDTTATDSLAAKNEIANEFVSDTSNLATDSLQTTPEDTQEGSENEAQEEPDSETQ